MTPPTVEPDAKSNARCTVIVLNFNGEHLLPDCLDSLARQTGIEIDTVVVDNASTDGSAALVAQRYPWARFIALKQNSGFSIANNVALRDALERGSEYALLLKTILLRLPILSRKWWPLSAVIPELRSFVRKSFLLTGRTGFGMRAAISACGRAQQNIVVGSRSTAASLIILRTLRKPRAARCLLVARQCVTSAFWMNSSGFMPKT